LTLSPTASATLSKMILMISDNFKIKIDNSEGFFAPVYVEEIFYTNRHKLYSVAHYIEMEDGSRKCNPEMNFIYDMVEGIYVASYYRQDGYKGKELFSAYVSGEEIKVNDVMLSADLTRYANFWLTDIKKQQRL